MTICRVQGKDLDRADVEIVLQCLAAGYPFLAARLESKSRVEWFVGWERLFSVDRHPVESLEVPW